MTEHKKAGLTIKERDLIVAAIKAAERGNIGEVRVHIEEKSSVRDVLARARTLFVELGMRKTKRGTGVLLYVALRNRTAAVYAGPGIHGAREPGFWQGVVDAVSSGYKKGKPAEGITKALGAIGDLLREHAAGEDVDGNELPDQVTTSSEVS
jgi:uncharacterized membrane protein